MIRKNTSLLLVLMFFFFTSVRATHYLGGDMITQWISGNDFKVKVFLYRDGTNGTNSFTIETEINVFDAVTHNLQQRADLNFTSLSYLEINCLNDTIAQIEQWVKEVTITLPDNPNGYY